MIRLLCAIMLAIPIHGRPQMIPTEYVTLIDHNTVISKTKKRSAILEQLIFYRQSGQQIDCVGYLLLRPDTSYDLKRLTGGRWELNFCSRSGEWRRVVGTDMHGSETSHDPEMKERERGERGALFGLGPWGDVAG